MSKKMMKRSLALGALMAFVITGQAFAAVNITLGENEVVQRDRIFDTFNVTGENGSELEVISSNGAALATKGNITGLDKLEITSANGWSTIELYGNTTIEADTIVLNKKGESGSGIFVTSEAAVGTEVTINFTKKLDINSESGGNAIFNYQKNSVIKVNGGTEGVINMDIDWNGIYAGGEGSTVEITAGELIISSTGENSGYPRGLYARGNGSNINVDVSKTLEINVEEGHNALYALGDGSGISLENDGITTINGNIVSKGDKATVNAIISGTKSIINGSVTTEENAATNLTLNGATWNVTGESNVTTLSGSGANLVVSELTEGLVTIGTDNTEQLTVIADASVASIEGDAETKLKTVMKTVAITNDAGGDDSVNTAQVTNDPIYENLSAKFNANGEIVGDINKQIASANISVNDMVAIGMMSWRAEMNDMNKRMGELRNANGEHGVWVRMVRGESEYNSVKNQYNQYQLGYDEKLSTDPSWTVGVALSYTDAENNFKEGNGESTNKALSIYGSKLNEDGTFVDLIAKYARLENDFKTYSGMGDADYDTNAYSFSAEVGKRIQQGKGLWIEPQVELTYGKVSAVDYVTKNDVAVAQDGMESLVGRIGFSLGKDIEKGNVYARASYLYDFDGETNAVLDGDAVLKNDLGGGWWEVGVGANINLSKATYIYADIEKTFGGEVDTNWQWNLGVRYSF